MRRVRLNRQRGSTNVVELMWKPFIPYVVLPFLNGECIGNGPRM